MSNRVGDKPQENLGVCHISKDFRGIAVHRAKSTLGPEVREADGENPGHLVCPVIYKSD